MCETNCFERRDAALDTFLLAEGATIEPADQSRGPFTMDVKVETQVQV